MNKMQQVFNDRGLIWHYWKGMEQEDKELIQMIDWRLVRNIKQDVKLTREERERKLAYCVLESVLDGGGNMRIVDFERFYKAYGVKFEQGYEYLAENMSKRNITFSHYTNEFQADTNRLIINGAIYGIDSTTEEWIEHYDKEYQMDKVFDKTEEAAVRAARRINRYFSRFLREAIEVEPISLGIELLEAAYLEVKELMEPSLEQIGVG